MVDNNEEQSSADLEQTAQPPVLVDPIGAFTVMQPPDVGEPLRAVLVRDGVVVEGPMLIGSLQVELYGKELRLIDDDTHPVSTGWLENPDGSFTAPEPDAAAVLQAIDQLTQSKIESGHEFPEGSGQFFSLSARARANVADYLSSREDASIYPIALTTLDNAGAILLQSAEDLDAFAASQRLSTISAVQEGAKSKAAALGVLVSGGAVVEPLQQANQDVLVLLK